MIVTKHPANPILDIAPDAFDCSCTCEEFGSNHFDKVNPERLKKHLVDRLEAMGYAITLNELSAAA